MPVSDQGDQAGSKVCSVTSDNAIEQMDLCNESPTGKWNVRAEVRQEGLTVPLAGGDLVSMSAHVRAASWTARTAAVDSWPIWTDKYMIRQDVQMTSARTRAAATRLWTDAAMDFLMQASTFLHIRNAEWKSNDEIEDKGSKAKHCQIHAACK